MVHGLWSSGVLIVELEIWEIEWCDNLVNDTYRSVNATYWSDNNWWHAITHTNKQVTEKVHIGYENASIRWTIVRLWHERASLQLVYTWAQLLHCSCTATRYVHFVHASCRVQAGRWFPTQIMALTFWIRLSWNQRMRQGEHEMHQQRLCNIS